MLRIRLSRTGKKRQPSYRIVVAESNAPRDGRIVERIGHYNPLVDPIEYNLYEDRALYWLSVGAQPSDAVSRLLVKGGTMARLERLRAGESIDDLVAEVTGQPAAPAQPAVAVAEDVAVAAEEVEAEETEAEEVAAEEEALEETGVVEALVDEVEEVVDEAEAVVAAIVEDVQDAVATEEE